MRVGIGTVLIVIASILFTVLLQKNTPWIIITSPLFVIGFGFIYSKIHEMEDDIIRLEAWLKLFIKRKEDNDGQ